MRDQRREDFRAVRIKSKFCWKRPDTARSTQQHEFRGLGILMIELRPGLSSLRGKCGRAICPTPNLNPVAIKSFFGPRGIMNL